MTIRVHFDAALSRMAGGASEAQVTGQTVRDALFQVARAFPALHLFNCEGELRRIVRVLHGSDGRPAALADVLTDGDTLRLTVE
jgi:hypothetical protein